MALPPVGRTLDTETSRHRLKMIDSAGLSPTPGTIAMISVMTMMMQALLMMMQVLGEKESGTEEKGTAQSASGTTVIQIQGDGNTVNINGEKSEEFPDKPRTIETSDRESGTVVQIIGNRNRVHVAPKEKEPAFEFKFESLRSRVGEGR